MISYLLDTNHAGVLIDPAHPLRLRVTTALISGDIFYVPLLVVAETVFGFSMLPRAARNAREWASLRLVLRLVSHDEADAMNAAALQVTLRRRGWQLSTIDALIATAALRYRLTLLTTDGDFRAVTGLASANWLVP